MKKSTASSLRVLGRTRDDISMKRNRRPRVQIYPQSVSLSSHPFSVHPVSGNQFRRAGYWYQGSVIDLNITDDVQSPSVELRCISA